MGRDIHFYAEQRGATGWRRTEDMDVRADATVRCVLCGQPCSTDGEDWLHQANTKPNHTLFGVTVGELLGYDWGQVTHHVEVGTDPDLVRLTWTEPLSLNIPRSFYAAVLRMARLAADDLDSVRCVFWLDG